MMMSNLEHPVIMKLLRLQITKPPIFLTTWIFRYASKDTKWLNAEGFTSDSLKWSHCSREVKKLWGKRDNLILRNRVLYLVNEKHSIVTMKLVVPESLEQQIFVGTHSIKSGGHYAFKHTLEKKARLFYWPGLQGELHVYLDKCKECATQKTGGKKQRTPLLS